MIIRAISTRGAERGSLLEVRTYPQLWHELAQRDEKEVQVEEELELLIENDRKETGHVVLLIADDVGRIARFELVCRRRIQRQAESQSRRTLTRSQLVEHPMQG